MSKLGCCGTMKKQGKIVKILSDQPTALIAPSDYEHIFTYKKKSLNNNKMVAEEKGKIAKLKVPSDQPTALIAPSDYEHIFKWDRNVAKKTAITKTTVKIPSDQPTALIAPSDYEHVFTHAKHKIKQQAAAAIVDRKTMQVKSDVPTVLIAPVDYEHVFTAKMKTPAKVKANEAAKIKLTPARTITSVTNKTPVPILSPKIKLKETQVKLQEQIVNTRNLKENWKSLSDKEVLPASIENLVNDFIAKQPQQYTINY